MDLLTPFLGLVRNPPRNEDSDGPISCSFVHHHWGVVIHVLLYRVPVVISRTTDLPSWL